MFPDMKGIVPAILTIGAILGAAVGISGYIIITFLIRHVSLSWVWQ